MPISMISGGPSPTAPSPSWTWVIIQPKSLRGDLHIAQRDDNSSNLKAARLGTTNGPLR